MKLMKIGSVPWVFPVNTSIGFAFGVEEARYISWCWAHYSLPIDWQRFWKVSTSAEHSVVWGACDITPHWVSSPISMVRQLTSRILGRMGPNKASESDIRENRRKLKWARYVEKTNGTGWSKRGDQEATVRVGDFISCQQEEPQDMILGKLLMHEFLWLRFDSSKKST